MARCTVERLMRELGLPGAVRGKKVRTTIRDDGHERAAGPAAPRLHRHRPNRRWVADFTHVATWAGIVYVAFVVDIFSRGDRRLVRRHQQTDPARPGRPGDGAVAARPRRNADQHRADTSLGRRVAIHVLSGSPPTWPRGIAASIGTVGDALDNALMESTIGLYKTELIKPRRPWQRSPDVELATAEWVDWYNHRRLHGEIGHIPPVEYETDYYAQHHPQPAAGVNI